MPILGSAAAFLASLQERMHHLEPRKRIVFPEGDDLHLIAAARLDREGLVEPVLFGG
jgi:phosphotransacetylase